MSLDEMRDPAKDYVLKFEFNKGLREGANELGASEQGRLPNEKRIEFRLNTARAHLRGALTELARSHPDYHRGQSQEPSAYELNRLIEWAYSYATLSKSEIAQNLDPNLERPELNRMDPFDRSAVPVVDADEIPADVDATQWVEQNRDRLKKRYDQRVEKDAEGRYRWGRMSRAHQALSESTEIVPGDELKGDPWFSAQVPPDKIEIIRDGLAVALEISTAFLTTREMDWRNLRGVDKVTPITISPSGSAIGIGDIRSIVFQTLDSHTLKT